MDEKDMKIIEVLKKDSSMSTQAISKEAGIPVTTVHNRIKRMKDQGIIKGYTVMLDHSKIGLGISAYILMHVDYLVIKERGITPYEVVERIRSIP